ncbi:MAG TPA: energy-coupling factor transporter ATPase [Clostridiales bacterium]|nr:energy-coupling factor transporter ATPase [Clostridiales bacterium]
MYAIEFENVCFSYSGTDVNDNLTKTEEVLSDLCMKVEKGAFVALLGRNGSGKSTCAKLINGLLVPTSGKVTVLGMDTQDKKSLFEIRKKAGMVFQNPDNQQVASIVEDDVAFGPENIGMPREEMKKRIDYALKVTGTEEFRKAQASRLSGGQKQRVAIAGAIAINPEILILDESTSMLDPKGRREVMSVIRTLNREEGMTVIDITHYMDEAAEADAIYVLNEGKIAKTGTPEEVFSDSETLERCGLELPRAALIAKKLKEAGLPIDGVNLDKGGLSEKLCELFRKV